MFDDRNQEITNETIISSSVKKILNITFKVVIGRTSTLSSLARRVFCLQPFYQVL
jgi:hypothetical protein